jgi:hypothetical protein
VIIRFDGTQMLIGLLVITQAKPLVARHSVILSEPSLAVKHAMKYWQ